jgi:hypothetical protein
VGRSKIVCHQRVTAFCRAFCLSHIVLQESHIATREVAGLSLYKLRGMQCRREPLKKKHAVRVRKVVERIAANTERELTCRVVQRECHANAMVLAKS